MCRNDFTKNHVVLFDIYVYIVRPLVLLEISIIICIHVFRNVCINCYVFCPDETLLNVWSDLLFNTFVYALSLI